jgi:hypothetical protein
LRNDWHDLGTSFLEHVKDSLDCEEPVGIHLFTDALKENWKIMMIVELLDFNFPVDFVLRTMLNCNWQVSSVIKQAELTDWNLSACNGACTRLLNLWSFFGSVETGAFATKTITFFKDCGSDCCK